MPVNVATAEWNGDLMSGSGHIKGKTGAIDVPYSLKSRTENTSNTNPEELIGAAHAGCYTMMLSALLTRANTPPTSIHTEAKVTQEKIGEKIVITRIDLSTSATVPGIDDAAFQAAAQNAKENCPVSVALKNVGEITLKAELKS